MSSDDTLPRQYLRFVSRLYDLAAEFSPEELEQVRGVARTHQAGAIAEAADALAQLAQPGAPKNGLKRKVPEPAPRSEAPLREAFSSRELFPTKDALAAFLAPYVKVKPRAKESRERFAVRADGLVGQAPPEVRSHLERALSDILARNPGTSFVNKWSRLIRGL